MTDEFACWGSVSGLVSSPHARNVLSAGEVKEMAFSENLSCYVTNNQRVRCKYPSDPATDPGDELLDSPAEATSVAAGAGGVCAFGPSAVACHRRSTFGAGPWKLERKVRALAVGKAHMCAAHDGGGVTCRGEGPAGGEASALDALDALALAAGDAHTCALLANHTVKCWGRNDSGQLGDRTTNDAAKPVQVLALDGVARIKAGRAHTCALLGNGTVHCWGNNAHHQLANGDTKNDGRAQMVLGILGVIDISAAADATCAILGKDGEVRCWGNNDETQLGDGTREEHTVPAPIRFH